MKRLVAYLRKLRIDWRYVRSEKLDRDLADLVSEAEEWRRRAVAQTHRVIEMQKVVDNAQQVIHLIHGRAMDMIQKADQRHAQTLCYVVAAAGGEVLVQPHHVATLWVLHQEEDPTHDGFRIHVSQPH